MFVDIKLPVYFESKDALIFIIGDMGEIHVSWEIGGKILVFNYVPENYPPITVLTYKTIEEYKEDVRSDEWLQKQIKNWYDINTLKELKEEGFLVDNIEEEDDVYVR
ncbi:hypothetical protein V7D15_06970 [Thermoanaerobacter thermohydrosulfuricus]